MYECLSRLLFKDALRAEKKHLLFASIDEGYSKSRFKKND